MFDDSTTVIQTEDVDSSPVLVARPLLTAMQYHIVALCDCAPEVNPLARVLLGHALEVRDKCLLAIGNVGLCWM